MAKISRSITIKTPQEIELMRQSGTIAAQAMKAVIEAVKPGVNLKQLDQIAENLILESGAGAAFKTVKGYYWSTCLTVNDEVVHGVPREEVVLKSGDIVGIDLGAYLQGWFSDTAWTVGVGEVTKQTQQLLRVGEQALWQAVDQAVEGNHIGDISSTIQQVIEDEGGYSVVRALIGHGVGKELHEAPEIPGVGKKGTGPLLKSGMTLAIEVIYNAGDPEVYQKDDGWTIASQDGSLAGLFEMTVVVGKEKAEVLTDWRSV